MLKIAHFHLLDYTLGLLLRFFWEPFALKRSHFWHWHSINKSIVSTLDIEPDQMAEIRSGLLSQLLQTNFRWKKVSIIKPKNYTGEYQIGFLANENGIIKNELCDIIVKNKIGVLLGPYKTNFFAISYPAKKPIDLIEVETTVKDKLASEILLL